MPNRVAADKAIFRGDDIAGNLCASICPPGQTIRRAGSKNPVAGRLSAGFRRDLRFSENFFRPNAVQTEALLSLAYEIPKTIGLLGSIAVP
jgi:hypothetical protein